MTIEKNINTLEELTTQAEEGYISGLDVYVELKKAIDHLSALQDRVKPIAIEEASKEDEKQFEKNGASIQYRDGAGRWDFKGLDDWTAKKGELSEIESRHKAAYQQWQRGLQMVDENGEVVAPAAFTPGAATISVSFRKPKAKA